MLGRPDDIGFASSLLYWSPCRQIAYFDEQPKIICWADKEGEDGSYSMGCDMVATTSLMLCLHHYRRIIGRDPKE